MHLRPAGVLFALSISLGLLLLRLLADPAFAEAVPLNCMILPGKEVEMCRLTSGGDRYVKPTEGHRSVRNYPPRKENAALE